MSQDDFVDDFGFVYLVLTADRAAGKIGFTTNPRARFAQLQTAHHLPLSLEFAIPARKEVEKLLHEHFKPNNIRLEWFSDVDALEEFYCELETEYADNQLREMFDNGSPPDLNSDDFIAVANRSPELDRPAQANSDPPNVCIPRNRPSPRNGSQ